MVSDIEQIGFLCIGIMAAYWLCGMDHSDEGPEKPLKKWWKERHNEAYKFDPGMKLTRELIGEDSE